MNKYMKYGIVVIIMSIVKLIMGYIWLGEVMILQVIVDIPETAYSIAMLWIIFRVMILMDKANKNKQE